MIAKKIEEDKGLRTNDSQLWSNVEVGRTLTSSHISSYSDQAI